MEISVDRVDYSRTMLREIDGQTINDLKQSIKTHGVLQPIVVFMNEKGRYEVICGNHRLCAAKGVGLKTIPFIIRQLPFPEDALVLALTENVQRFEMNPIKEGEIYASLLQRRSIEMLIREIGKSRYYIEGRVKMFSDLHPDLKEQIGKTLTITNAISLAKLPKARQLEVYERIRGNLHFVEANRMLVGGGNYTEGIAPKYCTCEKCGAKHLRGVSINV